MDKIHESFVKTIREKVDSLKPSDNGDELFFVPYVVGKSQPAYCYYGIFSSEKRMMAAFAGELESLVKLELGENCLDSKDEFNKSSTKTVELNEKQRRDMYERHGHSDHEFTEDDYTRIYNYTGEWEFFVQEIVKIKILPDHHLETKSLFKGDIEFCESYNKELRNADSSNFAGAAGRVVAKGLPNFKEPSSLFPVGTIELDSKVPYEPRSFSDWVLLYFFYDGEETNSGWRFDQEMSEEKIGRETTEDEDDEGGLHEYVFMPVDTMQSFL